MLVCRAASFLAYGSSELPNKQTWMSLGFQRIAGSKRGSSADLLVASAAHHVRIACNEHLFNILPARRVSL